jgi:hypothetical protein
MRDVAGCSDGWARWALRSDEEEKDDKYRNCCANGDAPCDLSVGHDGVRDGARCGVESWMFQAENGGSGLDLGRDMIKG